MARTKTESDTLTCPPVDVWFSVNLATLRALRQLSLRELGELVGMDKRCVWRIEHRLHSTTIATANALANAMGVELADMLESPAKFSQTVK